MNGLLKSLRCIWVPVCCVLIAASTWGISPRVAVCTPAETPPVLDGKLDDPCWKTAGVAADFLLDSGKGIASDRTTARLCFDRENLYIGITCPEDDWGKVKATVREHDGPIDSDDDIEIFFDTNEDRKTYYQFMLNTLGTQSDILNGSGAWDCAWTVKVQREDDHWLAEVSIPLKVLGKASVGTTWGFNIGRGQPGKQAWASFAGITGKWAVPGQFATLRFAARDVGEGRIFKQRGGVQVFALHPQQALDLQDLPSPDDEHLAAFGTPGETVPWTFHVFNVEPKTAVTVKISATPFTGPAGTLPVPAGSFLYLYQKIAGTYAWEFLGEGDTVTVPAGQRGGWWLDFKVPVDAKPGLYRSTVTLAFDGRRDTRTVKLLVLPFTLDANPTSCGFHTPRDRDDRMRRESLRLMREHGMTTFAPYGGWGGVRGVPEYAALRKEFGFKGKPIYADGVMYVGDQLARQMNLPKRGPASLQKGRCWVINDDYKSRYVADVKRYYDAAVEAGVPEMSFSIGDELTNDGYYAALHSIERAKVLREGIPKIMLTTDTNGYTEAVGCSKYLNCVGVNDGWDGPDNHNGGRRLLTPAVMTEIKANGCGIEFVNTGTDRFPYGFYLWRMLKYGVQSKIEWIWDSSRMSPAWLNVYREEVRDGRPTGKRVDGSKPPAEWKTFVTVALKFSRMGTYDAQYAATLENLLKTRPDAKAAQFLADVTDHIPLALAESRTSGWDASRADTVRWELARHIMRVKGTSVGVAPAAEAAGELKLDPASRWTAEKLEKKFVRHKTRTFACAKAAAPPTLDGNLDDAAWSSAEVITGVYDDRDISLVETKFTVRTVHTADGVYLGVSSHEPKPEKLAVGSKGNDDPSLWQVDDVEVFIDPGKTGSYYHLIHDSKGTKTDSKEREVTWNGKWDVACRVEGNTWMSEVFLPFATFGGEGKPWAVFVGRGSPTRGEYYGILPIQGSWHDVTQFGTLEFKEPAPYLREVDFGSLQVGENKVGFVVVNPLNAETKLIATLALPDGRVYPTTMTLLPQKAAVLGKPFELNRAGEHELTLTLTDTLGKVLEKETFVAQVPELMSFALDAPSVFSTSPRRSGTVRLNVPGEKLAELSLDFEVIGAGVQRKVSAAKLGGNRLAFTLALGDLRDGKYRLKATLRQGNVPTAVKETEFFVTTAPAIP